jgi:hypothetical protein
MRFVFTRDGLSWKLSNVVMPMTAESKSSDARAKNSTSDTECAPVALASTPPDTFAQAPPVAVAAPSLAVHG